MQENIIELCEALQLNTIKKVLPRLLEQADRQDKRHDELLYALLMYEVEERKTRRTARKIKEAHFPLAKSLDSC
jgi:DNA replication protein DnaC